MKYCSIKDQKIWYQFEITFKPDLSGWTAICLVKECVKVMEDPKFKEVCEVHITRCLRVQQFANNLLGNVTVSEIGFCWDDFSDKRMKLLSAMSAFVRER